MKKKLLAALLAAALLISGCGRRGDEAVSSGKDEAAAGEAAPAQA